MLFSLDDVLFHLKSSLQDLGRNTCHNLSSWLRLSQKSYLYDGVCASCMYVKV
jgi:hypothetical protein